MLNFKSNRLPLVNSLSKEQFCSKMCYQFAQQRSFRNKWGTRNCHGAMTNTPTATVYVPIFTSSSVFGWRATTVLAGVEKASFEKAGVKKGRFITR